MANAYVPSGNGSVYGTEAWNEVIEPAVYDKQAFVPNIKEFKRLFNKLNIPKITRDTYNTLSQTTGEGDSLTYGSATETEVELSPAGVYVAKKYSANLDKQTFLNLNGAFVQNVEDALAEGIETSACSNFTTLSTNLISAASIDAAAFRNGKARLLVSAKNVKGTPESGMQHLILPSMQYDDVMAISEFTHADARGDSENPMVKGVFVKAAGVMLHFTNVLPSAGGSSVYGCLWIPEAFGISWNERINVREQDFELQHKIIGYANFGSNIVHDGRAVRYETSAV